MLFLECSYKETVMVDVELLKQLESSLNLYQETQETLDEVVRNARFIFGDEWMEKLPTAFDNIQMDTPAKILLKDNEKIIKMIKKSYLVSSEMENIKIDKELLTNISSITVEVIDE